MPRCSLWDKLAAFQHTLTYARYQRAFLLPGGRPQLWQLAICSVSGVKMDILESGRPATPAATRP